MWQESVIIPFHKKGNQIYVPKLQRNYIIQYRLKDFGESSMTDYSPSQAIFWENYKVRLL